MHRYEDSIALTQRTRLVTPGGSQTASKRPDRFPEGAFPAYIHSGMGARVLDVDGNDYVDWICGLGAVPLGYLHEDVTAAIICALENGIISGSLPTPYEEEVASRLVKIIPCAGPDGQVRFTKTGSEACAGAIRIARRATGRDLVLVVGYHGWHDWVQVTSDPHPGVPEGYRGVWGDSGIYDEFHPYITRVPYNNALVIEDIMKHHKVAAVILESTLLEPPHGNYLSDVVTLCTLHGAVSIFDEMVTGFRWARAGGQEYFGVIPDLGVFGKGLANGMPLACIVGPERFLRFADVVSGTFGGECLSLAAASAVLDEYEKPEPISLQWQWGSIFKQYCFELGIPITGYDVHPKITYTGHDMAVFLQETAKRGLLIHPAGFNVSAVLTKEDMEITYRALKGAKEALDNKVPLEGIEPVRSLFKR